MATKPVVNPVVAPKPVVPVDPTKLTGAAERAYRAQNPNSDYTKSVDMRNINTIADLYKNNQGVSADQEKAYKTNLAKWNMTDPNAPKPFDQQAFMDQMTGQINSMFDAQEQSKLAALRASRDKAVGDINLQMQNTAPEYAQKKNEADVVNAQGVKRLSELIASQGLTGSGENITAQTAQNNQRQNSLNTLNLQEQQQMNDYRNRIADLNNPANEQALSASLDAERSKAMLDAYNRANDVGYQRQQDAQQQQNWQTQFNYGQSQDAIHNQQANDQMSAQAKQQAADNAWREKTYNTMSASEKAQLAQQIAIHGDDIAWQDVQMRYNGEIQKATNQAQINAYTNP